MVHWLGFEPFQITYASDHFQRLFECAQEMIRRDMAYVDHCQYAEPFLLKSIWNCSRLSACNINEDTCMRGSSFTSNPTQTPPWETTTFKAVCLLLIYNNDAPRNAQRLLYSYKKRQRTRTKSRFLLGWSFARDWRSSCVIQNFSGSRWSPTLLALVLSWRAQVLSLQKGFKGAKHQNLAWSLCRKRNSPFLRLLLPSLLPLLLDKRIQVMSIEISSDVEEASPISVKAYRRPLEATKSHNKSASSSTLKPAKREETKSIVSVKTTLDKVSPSFKPSAFSSQNPFQQQGSFDQDEEDVMMEIEREQEGDGYIPDDVRKDIARGLAKEAKEREFQIPIPSTSDKSATPAVGLSAEQTRILDLVMQGENVFFTGKLYYTWIWELTITKDPPVLANQWSCAKSSGNWKAYTDMFTLQLAQGWQLQI